nr:O-antigen ligase family protein [Dietzia sp. DQ11-71]
MGIGVRLLISPPPSNAAVAAAYGLLVVPLGLAILYPALTVETNDRSYRLEAFAAGAIISVGAGLINAFQAVGNDYEAYSAARIFESSIGSSNKAAAVAAAVGFLIIGMAGKHRRARWLMYLMATPFLAAPIVFASRGPLVASIVVAVVATLFAGRGLVGRMGLVIAATSLGYLIVVGRIMPDLLVLNRFRDSASGGDFLSGRIDIWKYVWSLIRERPIFGWGPGGITADLLSSGHTAYPHQFALGLVVQVGIVGVVLLGWALYKYVPREWDQLTPSLLFLLVVSMVEPVLSTPGAAPLVVVLFALSASSERETL